jgi:hypothetical protein
MGPRTEAGVGAEIVAGKLFGTNVAGMGVRE